MQSRRHREERAQRASDAKPWLHAQRAQAKPSTHSPPAHSSCLVAPARVSPKHRLHTLATHALKPDAEKMHLPDMH